MSFLENITAEYLYSYSILQSCTNGVLITQYLENIYWRVLLALRYNIYTSVLRNL